MQSPNWKNRTIFTGDNLGFLRSMNSESVDLIATDPPFNKGRDFHATPTALKAAGASFQDRWTWDDDVHQSWVDTIIDDHPKVWGAIEAARYTHSDSMGAYLCFMAVRFLEAHRILKPTGSVYLHCDTTANSYVRMMLDAIFGFKMMRNEIVWHYQPGTKPKTAFGRKHDTIFWYTKSPDYWYVQQRQPPKDPSKYKLIDKDGRRYMWGNNRTIKYYLEDGRACDDVWTWLGEPEFNTLASGSMERTGYPTQKPVALYARIIQSSCPPDGIVLDPFAGCATTCVAAEQLGRQWVGIDLWEDAGDVLRDRMTVICPDMNRRPIIRSKKHPKRTDAGITAAQAFETPKGKKNRSVPSTPILRKMLAERDGMICRGCGFVPPRVEYLECDHLTPRKDGGGDEIENRILLCGPCNKLKKENYTLSGLRKENKKRGLMVGTLPERKST